MQSHRGARGVLGVPYFNFVSNQLGFNQFVCTLYGVPCTLKEIQ